jgi:hypothetical protein
MLAAWVRSQAWPVAAAPMTAGTIISPTSVHGQIGTQR